MAENRVPPTAPIQRKAVARKLVGSGLVRAPSTSSSIASLPIGRVQSAPITQSSGHPGALAPTYFDSTHHQSSAVSQIPQTQNPTVHQQFAGHVPGATQPTHHQNAPQNAHSPGQIASVGGPATAPFAPASPMQYQAYAPPSPGHLTRLTSVRSIDSTLSNGSYTPSSPAGSVASYQTDITSPTLSRYPTATSPMHHVPGSSIPSRSASQSSAYAPATAMPTCDQCRAMILPNVSVFDCLICSTAGKSTRFCVYCYTSGSAASAHSQHDQSYFVTNSDPQVQNPGATKAGAAQVLPVAANVWVTRKSAAGRLWYQHRVTGYRTHLRPMLAAIPPPTVPTGWEVRATPDGRKYYFNATTSASSWTIPTQKPLPTGWTELRTPDCVPFYVHQEHQLTCWERPGDPPRKVTGQITSPENTNTKAKSSKTSSKAVHGVAAAGAAVTLASALSDAADLSPAGIISATVAAAKLTHHGAKLAGKKMNKLAKSKQIRRASKMFGGAVALAAISDGGEFEGGDDFGNIDDGATEYGECGTEYGGDTVVEEETTYEAVYTESYTQQETEYVATGAEYGQPEQVPAPYAAAADPMQESYLANEAPPCEEPPVVVNNIYVTENVVYNEATVEQTYLETSQTSMAFTETQETTVEVPPEPIPDQMAPMPPPEPIYPPAEGLQPYPPPFECVAPQPPAEIAPQALPVGDPGLLGAYPVGPPQDGSVPPLVFEPVLAGPMMVEPPAEQNGVTFAPIYA